MGIEHLTSDEIINERFHHEGRNSKAYVSGYEYAVRHFMDDAPSKSVPYKIGTPRADAWMYGESQGRSRVCELNINGLVDLT